MHDSFLTINRLQIYELNHTPMNKVISSFCSSYIQYSSCIQFPEINLPQAWKEIRIHIMPDDWTLSNLAQRLFCYPQGNAFYMKVRSYAHNRLVWEKSISLARVSWAYRRPRISIKRVFQSTPLGSYQISSQRKSLHHRDYFGNYLTMPGGYVNFPISC